YSETCPSAVTVTKPGLSVVRNGAWFGIAVKSPSEPGICTRVACTEASRRSGLTRSNWKVSAICSGRFRRHALGLLHHLVDAADHVEGSLRQVVELAGDHALETVDRHLERHLHARRAGEDLCHVEGLRQEALDLAGTGDGELVLFR